MAHLETIHGRTSFTLDDERGEVCPLEDTQKGFVSCRIVEGGPIPGKIMYMLFTKEETIRLAKSFTEAADVLVNGRDD